MLEQIEDLRWRLWLAVTYENETMAYQITKEIERRMGEK